MNGLGNLTTFPFQVIPMMNPDGVYLGNYRGSLLGEFNGVLLKKQCHVNEKIRKEIINAEKFNTLEVVALCESSGVA